VPEPGPVGVRVEPLGEEFGPSVLPDGLIVLFGLAPAPVVLPSMELPVVVELPAVPPAAELPPAVPAALPLPAEPPPAPPPPPPPCASAKVEPRAKIEASATVLSFMAALSFSQRKNKETVYLNVPKKIKNLQSLNIQQSSSVASHPRLVASGIGACAISALAKTMGRFRMFTMRRLRSELHGRGPLRRASWRRYASGGEGQADGQPPDHLHRALS
jgi:hypothetical protein